MLSQNALLCYKLKKLLRHDKLLEANYFSQFWGLEVVPIPPDLFARKAVSLRAINSVARADACC